jgi:OOP family OmpA-OmpF porin
MKKLFLSLLIFFCISANAQKSCIYEFKNTFGETSGNGPVLTTLGRQGSFVEESLPELGWIKRLVYKFDKNCGLSYDMKKSMLNLRSSYSIEMYFKFDALDSWKRVIDFKNRQTDNGAYIFNGKLNFYNTITSDIAPVAPGEYTHYTFTYDANTKMIKIYADGIGKISFYDSGDDAIIDPNELHFFYDDLKVNDEASSGTVAYIKFFDYVVDPHEAKKNFDDLKKTMISEAKEPEIINTPQTAKAKLVLTVLNAKSLKPLACNIIIRDKHTGKLIDSIHTEGANEIELSKGLYMITAKTQFFAKSVEELNFTITTGTETKEIRLTPINVGETVKLDNVHFKQGAAELLPESYPVLDKLIKMMNDNPSMEIELSGHTDNVGDPKLNVKLSEERVALIKKYLVSKGIHENRIQGKGYGGSQPIASNAKEETRKLNRRVDFKVTKF